MIRVCLVQLKPGTAKTTCSVWLAAAFHFLGLRVVLVDADPGQSAVRWSDLVTDSITNEPVGLPWSVQALPRLTLYRQLLQLESTSRADVILIDCPQIEDHAKVAKDAMRFCQRWVMPIAPAPIEMDRASQVRTVMDDVASVLDHEPERYALLNRTNRRRRSKFGPDAEAADILDEWGFTVFGEQIHHSDAQYRQTFGSVPLITPESPFVAIAKQLAEGN